MDKLEMVFALLNRIKAEEEKKQEYKHAMDIAKIEAKKSDKHYWNYLKWDQTMPSNDKVKDACKMARALLLEISKDAKPV